MKEQSSSSNVHWYQLCKEKSFVGWHQVRASIDSLYRHQSHWTHVSFADCLCIVHKSSIGVCLIEILCIALAKTGKYSWFSWSSDGLLNGKPACSIVVGVPFLLLVTFITSFFLASGKSSHYSKCKLCCDSVCLKLWMAHRQIILFLCKFNYHH